MDLLISVADKLGFSALSQTLFLEMKNEVIADLKKTLSSFMKILNIITQNCCKIKRPACQQMHNSNTVAPTNLFPSQPNLRSFFCAKNMVLQVFIKKKPRLLSPFTLVQVHLQNGCIHSFIAHGKNCVKATLIFLTQFNPVILLKQENKKNKKIKPTFSLQHLYIFGKTF